jgi:hypothetical protein
MPSLAQQLVTRKEAAAYLHISPITLAKWDADGRHGLAHVKVGARVMYRVQDLDAFIQRNTHPPGACGDVSGAGQQAPAP